MIAKLTDAERDQAFAELTAWQKVDGRDALQRNFKFKDFVEAWGFMNRVALLAEKQDHHPEWSNVYNRVDVVLSTHDAGGLTQLDIDLASVMDGLAKGRTKK